MNKRNKSYNDLIYKIKKYEVTTDIRISHSIFAAIGLIIVLSVSFFYNPYGKEIDALTRDIAGRDYIAAERRYSSLIRKVGEDEASGIRDRISDRCNLVFLNTGDAYIRGRVDKETLMGVVNTINSLQGISVNQSDIVSQASMVKKEFERSDISFDRAISYVECASGLDRVKNGLVDIKQSIMIIEQSRSST